MQLRTMTMLECTNMLSKSRLGHLACARDGVPYVVPVFFACSHIHLYAFSMPGKKIDFMRANPQVSLIFEERGEGRAWRSVIVDGRFEELPDHAGYRKERDEAWALLSRHFDWWEPGALKPVEAAPASHSEHVFLRILMEQISGREAKEN